MAKEIIDSVEKLEEELARVREAQRKFSTYTQEQVDKIFLAAAKAANMARIPLAKMAVEETGMGVVEDKIIKNHYAAEYIYNKYKNTKTCGVIDEDKAYGTKRIAEPLGVICAVIPTTNPTSTAIFKTLISLKTRNGIIISPHPRAKKSTAAAAKIVLDAAVAAGAPENIISWIDAPSLEMTNLLMKEADIILATGGPGMVRAAYSSGKPALGVGAGGFAVADEAGGQGRAVFFAGRGGQTQDGAAERAGLLGQRGQELRVQDIGLDLPPDGRFRAAAGRKELGRVDVVLGELFQIVLHLKGQTLENGAVDIRGRGVHGQAVDRAAHAGQHVRRAAHALQKW